MANCPYPGCTLSSTAGRVCECDQRNPLQTCEQCGTVCSGGTTYCRACQFEFLRGETRWARPLGYIRADALYVPGAFYTAPVLHRGFLWALSSEGILYRLSPRSSAKPIEWSLIPSPYAGLNVCVTTDAMAPAGVRGPVLLVSDPEGIYLLSLVEPHKFSIVRHPNSREIVANKAVEQSPYFRGVSASKEFFSFLSRPLDGGDSKLVVRYFHPERTPEEPARIAGNAFLGPVVWNDGVCICGEDELLLYSTLDRKPRRFPLPSDFEPYFQRPARGVNVPPSQLPLALACGDSGWQAWIGGERQGKAAILEVNFDRRESVFHPICGGGCLCSSRGHLVINQVSHVEVLGTASPRGRFDKKLAPKMPVAVDGGMVCYFRDTFSAANHELVLGSDESTLSFEDMECNENSCCSIHLLSHDVLVSYLHLPPKKNEPQGMTLAHWNLAVQDGEEP